MVARVQDVEAEDAADPFAHADREEDNKLAAIARAFESKYVSRRHGLQSNSLIPLVN